MKTFKIIILFLLFIINSSCENIDIIEHDLPYEEVYIVSGKMTAGDVYPEITFTKSFPLNAEFNIDGYKLEDVTAYIKTEDQKIYPLEYLKDGIYKPKYSLKILPNNRYELFALIEETHINASTLAPALPEVVNVEFVAGHISCEIKPQKDVVYSCIYIIRDDSRNIVFRDSEFFSVEGPFDENEKSIFIRSKDVPVEEQISVTDKRLGVEIYAWDKSYKKYFETKNNNKPIDDIFSQGGGSINWNVTGDNVIGMFIGYSALAKSVYIE